jgi:hypothetical protein
MKISNKVCKRCSIDKNIIKLYSEDNNMDPKPSPPAISDLTVIERQLISRDVSFWPCCITLRTSISLGVYDKCLLVHLPLGEM